MANKKKSDDPALDALIAGTKHAVKGTAKGIRAGFKKAPLLATLITMSIPFLAIYIALLAQVKAVNDNPFAEMKAMGYTTIIVFFVLTLLIHVGLLSLIVFITKKIRAAKVQADPEVDHGVQDLYNALSKSTHLMKYFADPGDVKFRDPTDRTLINTPARVAEVQRHITHIQRLKTPVEKFVVRFALDDSDDSFQALISSLKNELKVDAVERDASFTSGGYYQVIITPDKSNDPLRQQALSATEFYTTHSVRERSWANIIIGQNDDLTLQTVPLFHTVAVGASGSGKSSVFLSYLNHYLLACPGELSLFDQGLVKFHAIDPKYGDLMQFLHAEFFDAVEDPTTGEQWKVASPDGNQIDLTIAKFYQLLRNRTKYTTTLDFEPTPEMPVRLLLMDEFPTAVQMMSPQAEEMLVQILRLGRSVGMYVISASQSILKKDIDATRDYYSIRIALRMEDPGHAAILFNKEGKFLSASGIKPADIPQSNKANGWATSGEGFLLDAESGTYTRFRYFHSTVQDRRELMKEYTPEELWDVIPEIPEGVEF